MKVRLNSEVDPAGILVRKTMRYSSKKKHKNMAYLERIVVIELYKYMGSVIFFGGGGYTRELKE